MLKHITNLLKGEVTARVESGFPERVLNICAESLAVTLHIDGKLSIAEIFPVANHDEILFVVKSLEQQWLADGGQILIWGVGSEQCYEYLSQFVENIALDRLDKVNTSEYNNLIICNI